MKSISLLVLLLVLLTSSAGGDVTITATDDGGGKLRIGYQTTGTIAPVAFALDIQLSNGVTFSNVTPLTQCFSYYPGSFRDVINPSDPDWQDPQYLPVAPAYDPGALGGLGTSGVTIEMASMLVPYLAGGSPADLSADGIIDLQDSSIFSSEWLTDAGLADLDFDGLVNFFDYAVFLNGHFDPIPAMSGDLFLLQLNGNGAEVTIANILLNSIRGGIVLEDSSSVVPVLPANVTVIVPEPATLFLFAFGGLVLRRRKS
ncbi:MAG: PEP-CTERM sorting domain-containing protein [Sedimentisphaerales bacterium]|nr:PEP-CTERM sorting domain-containing protein [Sedimentisphaerales bacterium]